MLNLFGGPMNRCCLDRTVRGRCSSASLLLPVGGVALFTIKKSPDQISSLARREEREVLEEYSDRTLGFIPSRCSREQGE